MVVSILILLVGFLFLVKGADMFVSGSSAIANALRIPSLIIGLTIVAFGTSAPEAAVSITAAIQGQNDIALGNIIGSNIFNLLVVVGVCAMLKPLAVDRPVLLRDFPFAILSCFVLFTLCWAGGFSIPGSISRANGVVLLIFFFIFLFTLITVAQRSRNASAQIPEEPSPIHLPMSRSILAALLGLVGVVIGGKLVVDSATAIALSAGVSEALVGLTIVAIGTSLPELVTSIVAAKKGESDIALGNAIGSNIFNVYFILGTSATISPLNVPIFSFVDILVLAVISVGSYVFALTHRGINRIEGLIMVLTYLAYTGYIVIR